MKDRYRAYYTSISIRKSRDAFAVKVTICEIELHSGVKKPVTFVPSIELGQYRFTETETEFGIWMGEATSHERMFLFLIDAARAGIEPQWSAPALRAFRKDRVDLDLDAGGMGLEALIKLYLQRAKGGV